MDMKLCEGAETPLAVSLDLDGTIIEKTPPGAIAFLDCCLRLGLPVTRDCFRTVERIYQRYFANKSRVQRRVLQLGIEGFWRNYNHLVLRMLLGSSVEPLDVDLITKKFAESYSPDISVSEDTRFTLETLRKRRIPLCIITDRNVIFRGSVDPRDDLCAMGLIGYFDFILGGTPGGASKPDPTIFMSAASRFGVNVRNLVHLGDDFYSDYQAALRAGARGLLLDRHQVYPEVPGTISRLSDVLDLFSHT